MPKSELNSGLKKVRGIRTCCVCGLKGTKSSLVRFVRLKDGSVELDLSEKLPGRGAYLCPNDDCFEIAVKKKLLNRALMVNLTDEDYSKLKVAFIKRG